MNFLALCQNTAQWSGKASASSITTVVGQSGVLLDIVNAVGHAWNTIQTRYNNWQWMRAEFSSTSIVAVVPPALAKYTAASFGITRWADWVYDQIGGASSGSTYQPMTLQDPTIGIANEQVLQYIVWEEWRARYGRGLQTASRPTQWSSDPAGMFCLGQPPNRAFTLNGEYYKDVQVMAVNIDIPEMPSKYHMAIVWRAALLLMEKDEADQLQYSRLEAKSEFIETQLGRDQRPRLSIGGRPIA